MQLDADYLKDQIPSYLTQEAKENLVKALNKLPSFPDSVDFYTSRYPDEIMQGDGWTNLGIIQYETLEKKEVKGIILSNSCDISPTNKRDIPAKVVFAPIIRLSNYKTLLSNAKVPPETITSKLESIRKQYITTLFYLPVGLGLEEEYIALLDDIHTIPYQSFENQKDTTKLFTLSQVGFYIFLFKLSVHFCRFHENILRDA
jgi:hypothetical protein